MADDQSPDAPPGSATVVQQGTPPAALLGSATDADPVPPRAGGATGPDRYELLEEIARGGMGAVYRARDRVFGREVGVKTLLRVSPEGSVIASRFCEEARITGQLQHPNIPPVHDLGTLPDGRPYLAMKLIKGRNLDAMLKARPDPSHDRGRYLAIFEQIAQGVAYAHAHSVIHRDLKPLNVMVGAFGEVQVMDWGLAKVLTAAHANTLSASDTETGPTTDIRPTRDESDETRAGSVLGTPAYMPPEQAIGAVDQIDTRSDVFGLGAVLCAVLTGKPPYIGADAESTRQLAARAKLDDAFARLDSCGAEPDLIALCKRCLSPERDGRPRDAGAVAKAVADLRAEAEKRARQAELDRVRAEGDRAKAELQAAEQRKRRKVQLVLLGSVMLLVSGVGAFAWWQDKQATTQKQKEELVEADRKVERAKLEGERDAEARNKVKQARDGVTAGLLLATDLRKQYKFKLAEATLAQAVDLAKSGVPERLAEVEQAQRDLAFVVQLDDIRFRKWVFIAESGGKGDFNTKIASPEYRKAFADRGLDLTTLDPAESAKRIATSQVKTDLVAAVDDWALYEPNDALRDRLLEIARKADQGDWTDRLRDPALWKDKNALAKLAAGSDPGRTSSAALSVLAELMERNGLDPASLLSAARAKHPTDFELAFTLGLWYGRSSKDDRRIGPYEAARALRPENLTVWNNLGAALSHRGDAEGAIAAYKRAIELDPKHAQVYYNLGTALERKGDVEGAIGAYERAIELDPEYAQAHVNLGVALSHRGEVEGAIAAWKRAIELDPKHAQAYSNLGTALERKGDAEGAIAACKKAIELDPKLAQAHVNLGVALSHRGDVEGAIAAYKRAIELDPTRAQFYSNLGVALERKGDVEGTIAACKKAIELDPKLAHGYFNLGVALKHKGEVEGAIAAWKRAIELDPKDAPTYFNLSIALYQRGEVEGAIAACKKAIELDPKLAQACYNLGVALKHKGDVKGAIAAYEKAIERDPKYAQPYVNLCVIYFGQKKYPEAMACAREAIKADPKYSNAHAALGIALQQNGDISGARAAFTEAARLDKRWASLLEDLPPIPTAPPPREATRP